jgi:hypothetical protein
VEPASSTAGRRHLPQLRFHAVEELVHALREALVLEHQRVTHHHACHARVLLAEPSSTGHDAMPACCAP